jgi:phosphoadenosine phosphosulfate reductase
MATIYQNGEFLEESWIRADAETDVSMDADLLVPLTLFLTDKDAYLGRSGKTALLIEPGDDVENAAPFLDQLALIAVSFPSFADGRGFSVARDLREHLTYQGDIRAVGNYILDQVPLARRCGVTSFEISKPEVLRALKAGEWPEVTKYMQPAFGAIEEVPEGTRPWARRSHREVAIVAAE